MTHSHPLTSQPLLGSLTSPHPLILGLLRTHSSVLLQTFSMVLSAIISILYIRSHQPYNWKFYPWTNIYSSPTPSPQGTTTLLSPFLSSAFLDSTNGTPLQYPCLENPMDRGAWEGAVHGFAKSQTRLSDFIFTFHFHALEKEMATHSSVFAWEIPWTEEPGGLCSPWSHRVGHD